MQSQLSLQILPIALGRTDVESDGDFTRVVRPQPTRLCRIADVGSERDISVDETAMAPRPRSARLGRIDYAACPQAVEDIGRLIPASC